jgi:hypothetical protein
VGSFSHFSQYNQFGIAEATKSRYFKALVESLKKKLSCAGFGEFGFKLFNYWFLLDKLLAIAPCCTGTTLQLWLERLRLSSKLWLVGDALGNISTTARGEPRETLKQR